MRVDAAMEKESIENGLQRREECDLGEVEGKRETLSLSLFLSLSLSLAAFWNYVN